MKRFQPVGFWLGYGCGFLSTAAMIARSDSDAQSVAIVSAAFGAVLVVVNLVRGFAATEGE